MDKIQKLFDFIDAANAVQRTDGVNAYQFMDAFQAFPIWVLKREKC